VFYRCETCETTKATGDSGFNVLVNAEVLKSHGVLLIFFKVLYRCETSGSSGDSAFYSSYKNRVAKVAQSLL